VFLEKEKNMPKIITKEEIKFRANQERPQKPADYLRWWRARKALGLEVPKEFNQTAALLRRKE